METFRETSSLKRVAEGLQRWEWLLSDTPAAPLTWYSLYRACNYVAQTN